MIKKRLAIDRFNEKYEMDSEFGCWLWIASIHPEGYGRFGYNYKVEKDHRWSYSYFIGPIPIGKEIDHLCGVRHCVNPEHLEAVTHAENCRRGKVGKCTAIRQRTKTHCPQGHSYDKSNTYWYKKNRGCKKCRSNGGQGRYLFSKGESNG